MLGIRTRGRRMVGEDETTELWRPPLSLAFIRATTLLVDANPGQQHEVVQLQQEVTRPKARFKTTNHQALDIFEI